MSFQKDFDFLYKKETKTAWIGIVIGEAYGRNKGIGTKALVYLEEQIKLKGLGALNWVCLRSTNPLLSCIKNGYQEIGRIKEFTFWQDQMWTDIRLENYLRG